MKSEELFEIDREISQIRKGIQQRQEKMSEWSVPLIRVLQPSVCPDQYLSKKYSKTHIQFYQNQNSCNRNQAKQLLKKHVSESRIRIRKHRNQLKELDELVKKRSVIRLLKLKEEKENQWSNVKSSKGKTKSPPKKEMSRTYDGSEKLFPRPEKQNSSFMSMKGEKLLEMYLEKKSRGFSSEQAAVQLKKQLGLGLENTPFYVWMEKKCKEEPVLKTKQESKVLKLQERHTGFPFFKKMQNDIIPKKDIYLKDKTKLSQNFQRRLLKIMRYHQNNIDNLHL